MGAQQPSASGQDRSRESDLEHLYYVFTAVRSCLLTGGRGASRRTKTDHYAKVARTGLVVIERYIGETIVQEVFRCGDAVRLWVRER